MNYLPEKYSGVLFNPILNPSSLEVVKCVNVSDIIRTILIKNRSSSSMIIITQGEEGLYKISLSHPYGNVIYQILMARRTLFFPLWCTLSPGWRWHEIFYHNSTSYFFGGMFIPCGAIPPKGARDFTKVSISCFDGYIVVKFLNRSPLWSVAPLGLYKSL